MDLRERGRAIEADEIAEYKNDHGIDDDGDASDNEITLEDIDGASGVSAFSVYDDIKAKLVRNGMRRRCRNSLSTTEGSQASRA